jgi:hypothetical protein
MTRLSSLFVAATLVTLPLSAFAQQTTAPVEKTVPSSVTSTTPPSETSKTPSVTTAQAIKSDAKSPVHEAKAKPHGKHIVKIHQTKEKMPVKTTKPAQS